jgi:hypothetical protein
MAVMASLAIRSRVQGPSLRRWHGSFRLFLGAQRAKWLKQKSTLASISYTNPIKNTHHESHLYQRYLCDPAVLFAT